MELIALLAVCGKTSQRISNSVSCIVNEVTIRLPCVTFCDSSGLITLKRLPYTCDIPFVDESILAYLQHGRRVLTFTVAVKLPSPLLFSPSSLSLIFLSFKTKAEKQTGP